jgi:cytochrome c oxidase assembly factor CtaG
MPTSPSWFALLTTNWSFQPFLLGLVLLGCLLYWRGVIVSLRMGYQHSLEWWRIALFYLAALSAFIALESPIDFWSGTYFWVHMFQHAILIFGAAPLALLSAPWMPLWRGVPLAARRAVLRPLGRTRWVFPLLHRVGRIVGSPIFAWLFFIGDLTFWHIPQFYDLTEANKAIHYTEHGLFLITGLLFWGQIIPSFPFALRMGYVGQIIYLFTATLFNNVLDLFLMTATTAVYPYYAALPRSPSMVSPVVDEHLAAGIMMTASIFAFLLLMMVVAAFWLIEEERRSEAQEAPNAQALARERP